MFGIRDILISKMKSNY